jgi:predicted AlkP superfamily phosphohydrolase/phosphomutase
MPLSTKTLAKEWLLSAIAAGGFFAALEIVLTVAFTSFYLPRYRNYLWFEISMLAKHMLWAAGFILLAWVLWYGLSLALSKKASFKFRVLRIGGFYPAVASAVLFAFRPSHFGTYHAFVFAGMAIGYAWVVFRFESSQRAFPWVVELGKAIILVLGAVNLWQRQAWFYIEFPILTLLLFAETLIVVALVWRWLGSRIRLYAPIRWSLFIFFSAFLWFYPTTATLLGVMNKFDPTIRMQGSVLDTTNGLFLCQPKAPAKNKDSALRLRWGCPRKGHEPPRPRVAMFCMDGLSWDVLLPMMAEGEVPHLAALARRGTIATLQTFLIGVSPPIWNTIATGVSPEQHGITDFLTQDDRPFFSQDRKVRAIWNLLSDQGLRSLVLNYYNTYPVEPMEGMMVSNFLGHARIEVKFQIGNVSQAIKDMNPEDLVYPTSAVKEVLSLSPAKEAVVQQMEEYLGFSRDNVGSSDHEKGAWEYVKFFSHIDAYTASLGMHYYPKLDPDFLLAYFQGVDIVQHLYYFYHHPVFPTAQKEKKARQDYRYAALQQKIPTYRRAVRGYYRYLDMLLGQFLQILDENTVILIVSDHGVEEQPTLGNWTGQHDRGPPGVFLISGPYVRAGQCLQNVTIYDVLPTLMVLYGLPVAQDWKGRPLLEAFCPEFITAHPVAQVDTYETSPRSVSATEAKVPEAVKQEMLEQLKALGYIQ